ncbi:MAG: hypothetical protein P1P59_00135 [Treponemataceae bacterium]
MVEFALGVLLCANSLIVRYAKRTKIRLTRELEVHSFDEFIGTFNFAD